MAASPDDEARAPRDQDRQRQVPSDLGAVGGRAWTAHEELRASSVMVVDVHTTSHGQIHGGHPRRHYMDACRRFDGAVRAALDRVEDASVVYPGMYGVCHTPRETIGEVLTIERELLAG